MRRYIEIEDGQEILQEAVKEGKNVANDRSFELAEKISTLQAQVAEQRHEVLDALKAKTDALNERINADFVSGKDFVKVADSLGTLAKHVTNIASDVSKKMDRSETEALINRCVLDPAGPGCQLVDKTVKQSVGLMQGFLSEKAQELTAERAAKEAEAAAEAGHVVHTTAEEFLTCIDCENAFSKAIKARIGDYLDDDDALNAAADVLRARGLTVTNKEQEKKSLF